MSNVVYLPVRQPDEPLWGEPVQILSEVMKPLLTPQQAALELNCTVADLEVRWERREVERFRIGTLRRYRIVEHPVKRPSEYEERREYMRDYQRRWMAKRRADYLEGKCCVGCGATEKLELHHRDPELKVSHRVWSWSEERRLAEIAKCDLLCNRCHNRRHGKVAAHGGERRWRQGCRCVVCVKAQDELNARRRAKNAAKRARPLNSKEEAT